MSSNTSADRKQNDLPASAPSTPSATRLNSLPFAEILRSIPPQIRSLVSETVEGNDAGGHSPTSTSKTASTVSFSKKRESSSSSHYDNDHRRSGKNAFFSQFFWGDLAVALAVGAAVGASIVA